MKKYTIYTLFINILLLLTACTKVIDVDVPNSEVKLVIEASINWQIGTNGNQQQIKLSLSTPYFQEQQIVHAIGANVSLKNTLTGDVFTFSDQENGIYLCSNFIPIVNNTYQLNIEYNGESYSAEETLKSVSGISKIDQSRDGGFSSEDLEINFYIPDPAGETNFYLIKAYEEGDLFASISDLKDEFIDGNEIKLFWEKSDDNDDEEAFVAGDQVYFQVYGISEHFYNYIKLLIEQNESGGNPFSSIPVDLKGNCINNTNPDKAPFGYFRLTQFDQKEYTVQ